jgi:hypothetical protein
MQLFAALAVAPVISNAATSAGLPPYPIVGHVIQELHEFDNPEGSLFSADGRFLYVSSSAELGSPSKGFHWIRGRGYISKLSVGPGGKLHMLKARLVDSVTAPLGMALNPVRNGRFPRGAIFVAETGAPLAEADGSEVKDQALSDAQVMAFNENGKVLGSIHIGPGSAVARRIGVAGAVPNALAFDEQGNLYVTETGFGGGQYDPPIATHGGGVYRFPASSLEALADGRDAPFQYIPAPEGGPDGIEVAPGGAVHMNTVGLNAGLNDPAEGGMYRLSQLDFDAGRLPPPFARGLGALDGLTFAGDKRLDTEVKNTNSVIVTPLAGGPTRILLLDKPMRFDGPADIAVARQRDGSYLLVVPELSALAANTGHDRITVIRLPADF